MLILESMISPDKRGTVVWLAALNSFCCCCCFIPTSQGNSLGKNVKQSLGNDYSSSPAVHTYLLHLEAGK